MNNTPRHRFPRGLSQPENGFRFSVDSLLLSCFISPKHEGRVADIGCGCGVVGLGLILANPRKNIQVTGLDNCPEMISHARQNSEFLNLSHRVTPMEMDVSQVSSKNFQAESFDLAFVNPPYRKPESGRIPLEKSRLNALFCQEAELSNFLKAAGFLLKNRGRIGLVFGAERLVELLVRMDKYSLVPKKILTVYGSMFKPARLVLIEGMKNAGPGLALMPPLILYDASNRITRQALEFCPFLGCNSGR
jgi:tRNA1Val (adenine37-N6)-methyltransferase